MPLSGEKSQEFWPHRCAGTLGGGQVVPGPREWPAGREAPSGRLLTGAGGGSAEPGAASPLAPSYLTAPGASGPSPRVT